MKVKAHLIDSYNDTFSLEKQPYLSLGLSVEGQSIADLTMIFPYWPDGKLVPGSINVQFHVDPGHPPVLTSENAFLARFLNAFENAFSAADVEMYKELFYEGDLELEI